MIASVRLGTALIIDGGSLQRSQVCRSSDEVLDTQEQWKAAMVGKGWSEWRMRDRGPGKRSDNEPPPCCLHEPKEPQLET